MNPLFNGYALAGQTQDDPEDKGLTVENFIKVRRGESAAQEIVIDGYYKAGDGGGGVFRWEAQSLAKADQGLIFAPQNGSHKGRWFRIAGESINIRWFGAHGDGKFDDSQPIQMAENAAARAKASLYFPPGNYSINSPVIKRSNVSWFGHSPLTSQILASANYSHNQLIVSAAQSKFTIQQIGCLGVAAAQNGHNLNGFHGLNSCDDIIFKQCLFKKLAGNKNQSQYGHGITLVNSKNCIIEDCDFESCNKGAYIVNNTSKLSIYGNNFKYMGNNSVHIQSNKKASSDIIINQNSSTNQSTNQSPYYITSGNKFRINNVIVSKNISIGKNKEFLRDDPSSGNADLFSLKDCYNIFVHKNLAKFGGDLGFAIERCEKAEVIENTASYNNSVGISVFTSKKVHLKKNICINNRQDHKKIFYQLRAYGGIRVEEGSENVIVEQNLCQDDQSLKTQDYGIVVLETGMPSYNVVISGNKCINNQWGAVFAEISRDHKIAIDHEIIAQALPKSHDAAGVQAVDVRQNGETYTAFVSQGMAQTLTHGGIAQGAMIIPVVSTVELRPGQRVGILQADNSIHWTAIERVIEPNQIELGSPVSADIPNRSPVRVTNWSAVD